LKETKSWLGSSNTPRCEIRTLIFAISYFLDKNFNLELTILYDDEVVVVVDDDVDVVVVCKVT
jgi:hypothetical protein